MEEIQARLLDGVWGPNARINNDFNGGPECAKQVPMNFRLATIAILTPLYIYTICSGIQKLNETHKERYLELKQRNMLDPTGIEKFMGLLCSIFMQANLWYKYNTSTLIFLVNPCHIVCIMLIIISFSRYSIKTELMALFVFSSAFGG